MDAAWILLVLITAGVNSQPAGEAIQTPPNAVHRTAYFAGQDGWSGSGSAAPQSSVTYDRYGQPINSGQTSAPLSSPFATTNNTTSSANSAARSNVSAPPWPSNSNAQSFPSTPTSSGVSTARTGSTGALAANGGWTSIGTAIAAPPLLIPQSPMMTTNSGNSGIAASRSGSSFPAIASNDQQPLHSVLTEPAQPSQPPAKPADDWTTGFNDNFGGAPAGISRNGSGPSLGSTVRQSDLVPVQPAGTSPQDARKPAGGRLGDLSAETDPWTQTSQPSLGTATGAISASRPLATNGTGSSPPFSTNGQAPIGTASNGQLTGGFNGGNVSPGLNPIGTNPSLAGRNPITATTTNEPQAWMPMIAAVLSLAGSLAANLYLGVSYLDARQKYQSLVRKTADTFRRVKSAAA